MKWKKIAATLLTVTLACTSLTACSTAGKDKEVTKVAMGRFVEKELKMPKAVEDGKECAFLFQKNPQGQLEVYASPVEADGDANTLQYTLNKDNTWTKSTPKWLNDKDLSLNCVNYAPDGTKYAVVSTYTDDKTKIKILKSKDNETAEEIILDDYKNEVSYEQAPTSIDVLEDNSILIGANSSFTLYQAGKKSVSFKAGGYNYVLSGSQMLTTNEKMDSAVIIDVLTGKTISKLSLDMTKNPQFTADKDGNWYQISSFGIQRMVKGGNTWEIILDGDLASMSKPSLYPNAIIKGDNDDFFVMYEAGKNGQRIMMHYVYDKTIPSTPDKTLSIVSLNENLTVRQAIADFQNKHQDVRVEYRAVMDKEDGTTITDHIKTINTELLAGKGADILVLDDMPVNSYIEKGVLADISDIIDPLVKNQELLGNIMKQYKAGDSKTYYAPLRISPVLVFGNKDAVKSTSSINAFADYAKTAKTPLFGDNLFSYSDLTKMLFQLYSKSFLTEKGYDRNGLINFLKQLKTISDQTKATGETIADEESLNSTLIDKIHTKIALLGITNLNDMYDAYAPISISDTSDGDYTSINGEFTGSGLIGINHASTQKKLASEFISSLYGETVQKEELGDGFPVNAKALTNYGLAEDDFCIVYEDYEITQPEKEKMQKILDICKTATTPNNVDQELLNMIITETKDYLEGKADAESTADHIINRTKTYLSE